MGGGFPQLCSDHAHAALSFCKAESALCFYVLAFVQIILRFASNLALFGPIQRRIGQTDAPLFAVSKIFTVAVLP